MNRDYTDGVKDDVEFFTGTEVEHTPAYGMKTLFVVGVKHPTEIETHLKDDVRHSFFAAIHSFKP